MVRLFHNIKSAIIIRANHQRNFNTCYTIVRKLSCNMSKKALVFLAPGAEEMEFVISADVLRRGGVSLVFN